MSSVEELTQDEVNAILAGGREKGQYDDDILAFAQSNKLGIPYNYSGKKAQSVKTGFESAKERVGKREDLSEEDRTALSNVVVRVREDKVFLIRKDLAKA